MKYDQSRPDHEVHHIHRPHGHGLHHDRLDNQGRSPAANYMPAVESGMVPGGETPAGAPGVPTGQYGDSDGDGY